VVFFIKALHPSIPFMRQFFRIVGTSFKVAFQELKSNKLRTFLSLLGVSIGIFCIVSVFTVLDSLENNIRTNVASLGNDVLYVGKWPWMDEGGEFKWWEYMRRPTMTSRDMEAVSRQGSLSRYTTLCYTQNNITARHDANEISGLEAYCVTSNFEKMQNFEISRGRYFNLSELAAGKFAAVVGSEVYEELFPDSTDIRNQTITLFGRKFLVIGLLKKTGDNMAGFNFDRCVICPYYAAASLFDVNSPNANSLLMVKGREGIPVDELSAETEGILRAERRLGPEEKNNFSINRLSQVTERLDTLFTEI
jgi:putative ABC transport system permease protein